MFSAADPSLSQIGGGKVKRNKRHDIREQEEKKEKTHERKLNSYPFVMRHQEFQNIWLVYGETRANERR